jgi:DNA-binding MarR family transcriptional regulator
MVWHKQPSKEPAMTAPATLNPSIVGQAEKHHSAVLTRALSGTTLDEQQWVTLHLAVTADGPLDRSAHLTRVAHLTRWAPADVEAAVTRLLAAGLLRALPGDRAEATPEGRDLVTRIRTETGEIVSRAYGSVSPEDLATAARVLTAITAQLSAELSRA